MIKNAVLLLGAFMSGLWMIKLLPALLNLSDLLSEYVFNPGKFFSLMVCFLISFVAHSSLITPLLEQIMQKRVKLNECVYGLLALLSLFVLFFHGSWQTISIAIFTIIYGLASINYKTIYMEGK